MVIYKGSIGSMNNFSIDDTIYVFKQDENLFWNLRLFLITCIKDIHSGIEKKSIPLIIKIYPYFNKGT